MRQEFGKHFLNLGLLILGSTALKPLLVGQLGMKLALVGGYALSLIIGGVLLKGGDDE